MNFAAPPLAAALALLKSEAPRRAHHHAHAHHGATRRRCTTMESFKAVAMHSGRPLACTTATRTLLCSGAGWRSSAPEVAAEGKDYCHGDDDQSSEAISELSYEGKTRGFCHVGSFRAMSWYTRPP